MRRCGSTNALKLPVMMLGVLLLANFSDCHAQAPKLLPGAPQVTPEGPTITLAPGKTQPIVAVASEAKSYRWTLQGEGTLSTDDGPAVIFTAPKNGGMSIIVVVAYNEHGDSPPTVITINVSATVATSLDALGVPAGWMSGGGDPSTYIALENSNKDCHTGPGCLKIKYRQGGVWGGIYWWPHNCGTSGTPEAWNKVKTSSCGLNLLEAGFSTVSRFTFWARGENGSEVIEFKVGGPDVAPMPGRSTGKVTLAPAWKQYEIDLAGVDVTKVIGLFVWIASDLENPQGATFFLDDIQFEGLK